MSILRNKIKSSFSQIPNDLITDSRLSHGAKLVAIYLMSKPDEWRVCNADIMKGLNISKPHTIAGYWRELIGNGWVTRIEKRESGKFGGGFDYEINYTAGNEPSDDSIDNSTEMPILGNAEKRQCLKTAMPKMGIHSNTESSNTDISNTKVIKTPISPLAEFRKSESKPPPTPKHIKTKSGYTPGFQRFFDAWPLSKRVGMVKAFQSWQSNELEEQADQIVNAVEIWKLSAAWKKNGGEFIPHPTTFLNQQRYNETQAAMQSTVAEMDPFDRMIMRAKAEEDRQQANPNHPKLTK